VVHQEVQHAADEERHCQQENGADHLALVSEVEFLVVLADEVEESEADRKQGQEEKEVQESDDLFERVPNFVRVILLVRKTIEIAASLPGIGE